MPDKLQSETCPACGKYAVPQRQPFGSRLFLVCRYCLADIRVEPRIWPAVDLGQIDPNIPFATPAERRKMNRTFRALAKAAQLP